MSRGVIYTLNKYRSLIKLYSLFILIFFSMFVVGINQLTQPVSAASTDVVINELMYHPASDNDDDEFLELYNKSGSTVDLNGWCFDDGISLCFEPGDEITAGGYILISPSAAQTTTTYSKTVLAEYTGKLSNGGETITLKDNTDQVASTLTYDDNDPWPASPDGTGPSLELIDATSDLTQPTSWAASLSNGGTPGVENSVTGLDLPTITNVTKHTIVDANTDTTITAQVSDATTVNLIYKVMFEADITIAMNDNGTGADATASDGIYSANIPGQDPGALTRFKISVTNTDGTTQSPGTDDTTNYYPYIADDGQTADIPIVRWYMDTDDYDDMTTNHLDDDMLFPAVVAVGDQIFDNSQVRVKGQVTVNFPKKKFKFELPKGYTVQPDGFDYPVDEFTLNAFFLNLTDLQESLGLRAFSEAGFNKLQNIHSRVQRNTSTDVGAFQGHYLLLEGYDKTWRERNDYQSGALYKQMDNKKTRLDEDDSDIQILYDNLTTLQEQELKQYLLDNLNIPAIVNYHAVSAATFHDDWSFIKNIYEYRDTEGTGRWEYLPWDLDNVFLPSLFNEVNSADYLKYPISMLANPAKGEDSWYYQWAIIERAMYQFPEFRDMFFRRSMVLYDQIWQSGEYLQWHDELYQKSHQTIAEDYDKWNPFRQSTYEAYFPNGYPYTFVDNFPFDVDENNIFGSVALQSPEIMRTIFIFAAQKLNADVAQARANGELLLSQTSTQQAGVKLTEIHYNPSTGTSHEFIELHNSSDVPVDVSGWTLEGVGFTFPSGSVLPANWHGVVVNNDTAFRTQNQSALVFGEYSGSLSNSGQQLTLKDSSGTVISSVNYDVTSPWPSSPNGQGYSLSLISTDADESKASCWAPSQSIGGTPYVVNTIDSSWDTSDCFTIDKATVTSNTGTSYSISSQAGGEAEDSEEESIIDDLISGSLKQPIATTTGTNLQDNQFKLFMLGLGTSLVIGLTANKAYATIKSRKTNAKTDISTD